MDLDIRRLLAGSNNPGGKFDRRRLEKLAFTDSLTGVGNRNAFDLAIPIAEKDEDTVIILFDANNFGRINKEIGQKAGDIVLVQLAQAIIEAADFYGVTKRRIFRRGGDEFVVLAPEIVAAQIIEKACSLYGTRLCETSLTGVFAKNFDSADEMLQPAKKLAKEKDKSNIIYLF